MDIMEELVDETIFAVVIEEHRKIKLGLHCPTKTTASKDSSNVPRGLVDVPGYDVFGLQPAKVAGEMFPCPNCASIRHPSKFAPHLEKCMGMGGRESRRVAANRSRQQAEQDFTVFDPATIAAVSDPGLKRLFDSV